MTKYTAHKFIPPYLEAAAERMAHVGYISISVPPDQYLQYDLSPAAIVNLIPDGAIMGITMSLRIEAPFYVAVYVEVEYIGEGPGSEFLEPFRRNSYSIGASDRGVSYQFIIERPLERYR